MKKIILSMLVFACVSFLTNAQQQREPGPNKIGQAANRATVNITELDGTTLTVNNLVEAILGPGITYSNVFFDGTMAPALPASAGTFTNGTGAGLEIDEGLILSSGYAVNIYGPNTADNTSGSLGTPGDPDLDNLGVGVTFDRTVLEFDFVPTSNTVYIEYVFGSEEYNEYVFQGVSDVFAFYVNGTNIALIPTTAIPVAIDNLNYGNPYGSQCNYCQYYNNNDLQDGGPFFDIEADGFTTKLTGEASVTPNQTNHIKIAIADVGDTVWDSWVFIKAESFSTNNPNVPLSSLALFIGLGMIMIFTIFRYRKMS